MTIINLTQHAPTKEQIAAGVFQSARHSEIQNLLTFVGIPTKDEISARASALAEIAVNHGALSAMIGGAPYLMSALERALINVGVKPLYAFSERVSVEVTSPEGEVTKTNVFKHVGFVEV